MTALQAAAAAVTIVTGIAGMISDSQLRRGISTIIKQLNAVLDSQEAIISDLKALRAYIDQALLISWREAYSRTIVSYRDQLDVYVAELESQRWRLSERSRDDLEELSREALTTTLSVGQMDVWAFPSFVVGAGVTLASDKILKSSVARQRTTSSKLLTHVDRWLDAKDSRSLPSMIASTADELAKKRSALDARSRTYSLKSRRERVDSPTGEVCTEWIHVALKVNGTIDAGFSGEVSTT